MERSKFMELALEVASKNASGEGGGPFGAVVVKEGEVIAVASNRVTPDHDPTAHAEINAIREACRKLESHSLEGCQLYSSCEPCPMCLAAAYWARLEIVYYAADREEAAEAGFDDSLIYDQLALPIEQRALPLERLLKEKGDKPFQLWRENEERVNY